MSDCNEDPDLVIIATGSEVWVALETQEILKDVSVRVVNLGCWELFDEQPADYRQKVLGSQSAPRVSIEAGITTGWEHYTGLNGLNIGIDTFGESAPGSDVADHFGIVPEKVADRIRNHLKL